MIKKLRDIGRCVGGTKVDEMVALETVITEIRAWNDFLSVDNNALRKENAEMLDANRTLNTEIHALKLVNWYHSNKESVTIPIHDFSKYRIIDQLEKVQEEYFEVIMAYQNDTVERTIEEATDLIQATLNLIEMLSPNGVHEALQKHSEKMATRGYKVKYELEVLK